MTNTKSVFLTELLLEKVQWNVKRITFGKRKDRSVEIQENPIVFIGDNNKALSVRRFMLHNQLNITFFQLHPNRKPKTKVIKIFEGDKNFLSAWKK